MGKAIKIWYLLLILPKLGFGNVAYMFWYRLSMRIGIRKKMFPQSVSLSGTFFFPSIRAEDFRKQWIPPIQSKAIEIMKGIFTWFSYHKQAVGTNPNWFYNPFEQTTLLKTNLHWTEYSDFNFNTGDVKIIWELSRFDWLTDLARAYKVSGDKKYLDKINTLLNDWSEKNPLNTGPQWKCGQETSFRLMKLITAAFLLDQYFSPSEALLHLIADHLKRIDGNIHYGIAQDNNHGSSEAIGLYIGAAWLQKNNYSNDNLAKYQKKGRKLLENRILKLVQPDGTFSQRSVTYHRVVMDTLSFALHNMQLLGEEEFNLKIKKRLQKLGEWQYKMTFGSDGDAPNFGSNDGAMVENLHSRGYRDFRPSTQLFFYALLQKRVYDSEDVSEAMYWRYGLASLDSPIHSVSLPAAEILDQQILILRNDKAKVFLKIPEDTFRPGNDAFHIDLWVNGNPVLVDTGSYSYNSGDLTANFKSVAAHNTIQFGDEEQMPKISRFLNGAWLKPSYVGSIHTSAQEQEWEGKYEDFNNNSHQRKIILSPDSLQIIDTVSSVLSSTSRFHLNKNSNLKHSNKTFEAEASLYYLEKHSIDLLCPKAELRSDEKIFDTKFTF